MTFQRHVIARGVYVAAARPRDVNGNDEFVFTRVSSKRDISAVLACSSVGVGLWSLPSFRRTSNSRNAIALRTSITVIFRVEDSPLREPDGHRCMPLKQQKDRVLAPQLQARRQKAVTRRGTSRGRLTKIVDGRRTFLTDCFEARGRYGVMKPHAPIADQIAAVSI